MASSPCSESPPPATKRSKISDFDSEIAPKVAKTQYEIGGTISNDNRNPSGSDSSQQSWFMPSSEASALSAEEIEGVDSGFSDATPAAFSEDSQEAMNNSNTNDPSNITTAEVATKNLTPDLTEEDEDAILEDAADLNLPKEDSKAGSIPDQAMPGSNPEDHDDEEDNQQNNESRDDGDDRLSDISGLSDLSGSDWKPTAGPFSWVQRQMMSGTDPRELLKEILGDVDAVIPDHLDQITLWKIILNMVSEPPRRKKLANVNTLQDIVHLIAASRKIIVLTGAGVSVSCGIPDFRSRDGVYARLAVDFPDLPDPQAMFDINYFRKDPRPFFKFAREIYPGQFKPSPCHKFIRAIEKHGKLLRNYTQNIDTLEQVAGINRAVQCHGSFATATCTLCKYQVQADEIKEDIFQQRIPYCPKCNSLASRAAEEDRPALAPPANNPPSALTESPLSSKSDPNPSLHSSQSGPSSGPVENSTPTPPPGQATTSKGIMKPDIVFFGEGLGDEFHKSVAIDKHEADLLIMIGSSLKVRPVALIPSSVSPEVPQILINREPLNHLTPDVELLGDCDGIINQICLKLGQGWEEPVHGPELAETQELLQEEDHHHQEISPPSLGVNTDSENPASSSTSNLPDGSDPKPSTSGDPSCHHDKEGRSQEEMEEERQRRIMAALWKPRKSIATQLKENSYFFKPPSRYIFPGAEVYPPRCDEGEGGDEGDEDSSSSSSDSDAGSSNGADSDDEGSAGEAAGAGGGGAGGPPSQYGPQPATSPTSKETSAELNGDMAPNSQVGQPSPMTSEMAKEAVQ